MTLENESEFQRRINEAFSAREQKKLSNIRFRQGTDGRFISSEPGRKIAILDHGQPTPKIGDAYDVEVIRDTRPLDPHTGALIVRILLKEKEESRFTDFTELRDRELDALGEAPIEDKKFEKPYIPQPIERDEENNLVYVLETVIPYNKHGGEFVPKAEKFQHFTLDQRTLETAEKVATAAELREPCLLEGETSTSKTSVIEYLAMKTNHEVVRLNLNGQTDTSELIGKFVPNDGQLLIKFKELLSNVENLNERSKDILVKANKEGRGLTLIESQQIAQAENLKVPDWRWQDGLDVQAKKNGQWLILDEINLAEAQILERLNSQLEKTPSITLSENGGITIRELNEEETKLYNEGKLPGIEPLNPNFRIFATMNPAEYSGRQPMSPAYKDRWTSYKFVKPPTAEDYQDMIELMVYGEQPEVVVRGAKYKTPDTEPLLNKLEKIPNFRSFAGKLAKFQEKIEMLSRTKEIGRSKKEPYVFTRRGLIEFLGYLENKSVINRKTKQKIDIKDIPEEIVSRAFQYYYLDKISNPEDLRKVNDQLDILGISESNWTHKFS